MTESDSLSTTSARRPSRVRVVDPDPAPTSESRRRLLRAALHGIAIPSASGCLLGTTERHAWAAGTASLHAASPGVPGRVVRDFKDPYIELLRLLHQAAEIEHALMIQYLYGAFSLKPAYAQVAGMGSPNSNDLLGVAIMEMQHLGRVNQLLVALGAAPTLVREDFPYEPDIYPFRFNLEPLSQHSLAKYCWTEAPVGATDPRRAANDEDRRFCEKLDAVLGTETRPNYVGSLYDAVIDSVREVSATGDPHLPDLTPWVEALVKIKEDGEIGHYQFFRRTFLGTHEGFGSGPNVWSLAPSDPRYPSFPLPVNPTAYLGHDQEIRDPAAQGLAWLGDLHYWVLLVLLTTGYQQGSAEHIALARGHMMGPFWSLARKLAGMGSGMPFDPLGLGYAPGATRETNARLLARLLAEADRVEKQLSAVLPGDFPADFCRHTQNALLEIATRERTAQAPTAPWDDGLGMA
jgi:Ferritin-like